MNKKHIALALSLLSVSPSIQSDPGAGVILLTLALFAGRLPSYRLLRTSTHKQISADQATIKEKQLQFMFAIYFWHVETCVNLLEEGLHPDFILTDSCELGTPLSFACEVFGKGETSNEGYHYSIEEFVCLLLRHGADINRVDRYNRTPLIQAIDSRRSTDFIRLLLEKGADPAIGSITKWSETMEYEMSALDLTYYHNNQEVAELLKEYGAKTNFRSNNML